MHSRHMAPMTSRALAAIAASAAIALTVTACSQNYLAPDPATCKAAMQAEYVKAMAGQGHFGTVPAACKGLPKAEVQRFAQQIRAGR